jgi:hypothetical protein
MRLSCVATAAILAGLLDITVALAQDIPADLMQARAERRDSMIRRNPAAFDKLTTAGFISVDQTGRVETKAERGARVVPPANPPQGALAPPQRLNEHTVMYNNDTVVFFWQQTTLQGLQNFMETWVRENGQWKCASSHFSLPAPAGGGGGRDGGRGRGGN